MQIAVPAGQACAACTAPSAGAGAAIEKSARRKRKMKKYQIITGNFKVPGSSKMMLTYSMSGIGYTSRGQCFRNAVLLYTQFSRVVELKCKT